MRCEFVAVLVIVVYPFWAAAGDAPKAKAKAPAVICLLEDDAGELLKLLTNPGDGAGQGEEEKKEGEEDAKEVETVKPEEATVAAPVVVSEEKEEEVKEEKKPEEEAKEKAQSCQSLRAEVADLKARVAVLESDLKVRVAALESQMSGTH